MALKVNCYCQGYSGVSEELVDKLVDFVNNDIIPCVPKGGTVSSGDFSPLAHIALGLIGEGTLLDDETKEFVESSIIFQRKNI